MTTMTYTEAVDHLTRWIARPDYEQCEPDGRAVKIVLDRARTYELPMRHQPFVYLRTWVETRSRARPRLSTATVLQALRVHGQALAARHAAEEDAFDASQKVALARHDMYAAVQQALRWKLAFLAALFFLILGVGAAALYVASKL
jgi:hypothetical protein